MPRTKKAAQKKRAEGKQSAGKKKRHNAPKPKPNAETTPAVVAAGSVAAPGDVLGDAATHTCGPGTCARDGAIIATLTGTAHDGAGVLTTARAGRRPELGVGAEVMGVVTRTNRTSALLDLVAAGGAALDFPARATLRREDALPPGRDPSNLDLTAQFAGSDLVRAVVVAVDDAARYHVSIAAEGMGLLVAEATS